MLSQKKYLTAFIGLVITLGPLFAITGNIVVTSNMTINPIVQPSGIVLIAALTLLMALNLSVAWHNIDQRLALGGRTTALGFLGALFTTSCPLCQPIWLVWLGFGSVTAFVSDISLYIGLFSLLMMLVSLHYSLKSVSNTCEVKVNGKNA